ncbi:MAG TPA: type II toxin-antitoxin system VapC family toxin [Nocardioidaceae bacterium]|nr:type II toxin-antitoxin system VapC family toxin [Nocardioidaceae bacterium]
MRIVLDTDVASGLIKRTLPIEMMTKIASHEAALTFVTVGELTRWIHARDLGERRRREIETFVVTRPTVPGGQDVARKWGEIIAYADKRGRPRPINDSWITACCLTYGLPLATLNVNDFEDFVEYEGLQIITA